MLFLGRLFLLALLLVPRNQCTTTTGTWYARLDNIPAGWYPYPAGFKTILKSSYYGKSFPALCSGVCKAVAGCLGFSIGPDHCTLQQDVAFKVVPTENDLHYYLRIDNLPHDGSMRVLLVHHDYTGGVFPPSAIGINQDDPAAKLYSILDRVEDFRAADGKFHFSLCYPDINPDVCIKWTQTSNPATTTFVTDLEYLGGPVPQGAFRGLAADSANAVANGLEGSGSWWWSVGCRVFHEDGKIPGPYLVSVAVADLYATVAFK